MEPKDYKIRCDNHSFKPYVYCEMCMIRTLLQEAVEKNKKMVESACASMNLTVNVIHDILDKQDKQIKDLKELVDHLWKYR